MNARRYFRYDWEPSGLGAGSIWNEFDGERPVRQAECYGGRWFSSRQAYHPELGPGLAEGLLSEMDYGPENEVNGPWWGGAGAAAKAGAKAGVRSGAKTGLRGGAKVGAKSAERPAAGGGAARQVDEGLQCNCLAARTAVSTAEGDKPIEQVKVGDRVWTRSLDGSGSQLRTVTGLFTKQVEKLLTVTVAGEQVKVTAEHPFLWVADRLLSPLTGQEA